MKTEIRKPLDQMSEGFCQHHVQGCPHKAIPGGALCELCANVGCQHHT